MRPDDSKIFTIDLPSNRVQFVGTSGVFPAKDTGFRMSTWPPPPRPLENNFPVVGDRRLMSGTLPEYFHRSCVGDLEAQDWRNRLDALRVIRVNNGRPVRDIDSVLNGPIHELTSKGREILG